MNWAIFSIAGYLSIALCVGMVLLWLLHALRRPRRWLCHIAVILGVAALLFAEVNSRFHVGRIQVDRSAEIEAQMSRQELARKAAEAARAEDVAPIQFAEDTSSDSLDEGGLDDAELEYFRSFDDATTPEWKLKKKERSLDAGEDPADLEAMIDQSEAPGALDPATEFEDETREPIYMTDSEKMTADRLDSANLNFIRIMLALAVLFVVADYFRRLNVYEEAYGPLPFPSRWADAMTPRDPVAVRSNTPRRSLLEDLRVIVRRGEVFVYMTDDANAAEEVMRTTMHRLPGGFLPVGVLAVADDEKMDDAFVFETLWFGRNCFVVDSAERAEGMLRRYLELMAERRATRARTRQTVHVVWDIASPVPEQTQSRFAALGKATGHVLLLCRPIT